MERINRNNKVVSAMIHYIQHYNPEKYWKMRGVVISPSRGGIHKLIQIIYLFRIKRMDAFNNASMGTDIGFGAHFETPPHLQHGLNGIIISHYAHIGKNAWIAQQVTIGQAIDRNVAPTIGDNVIIGTGAKIFGDIKIGNNVTVGANAVVTHDIPDNCVCGGIPATVIKYKEKME
ncbi:serine O-acetyltransferase [Clostridium paraputrificum]|uniref:serine O-acetyltransferase n=1 Tax=Clostridium paraputrificum TaxID=29363 RepID=UPI00040A94E0|nr:hypothetical protein [Clostridium paraputrificum]